MSQYQNGFQTSVNVELPKGPAGAFASANPRSSVVAGPGALVATPAGVSVGVFAWGNPTSKLASNYYQPSSFLGFVKRVMQAVITNYLGQSTQLIPGGDAVDLDDQGDYWGIFASGGTAGQKVYANPVTGVLTANATGQAVTASLSAGGASIASSVLTTTDADATGTIAVGQLVTTSGLTLPPGTYIASADGTGSGTHLWNLANLDGATIPDISAGSLTWKFQGVVETKWTLMESVDAAASTTGSIAAPVSPAATGILTISAVGSGVLKQGQFLTGTGIPVNIQLGVQLSGTAGSTGTYATNYVGSAAITSTTITAVAGQLGKISSWN